jgi:hypothetical protein
MTGARVLVGGMQIVAKARQMEEQLKQQPQPQPQPQQAPPQHASSPPGTVPVASEFLPPPAAMAPQPSAPPAVAIQKIKETKEMKEMKVRHFFTIKQTYCRPLPASRAAASRLSVIKRFLMALCSFYLHQEHESNVKANRRNLAAAIKSKMVYSPALKPLCEDPSHRH